MLLDTLLPKAIVYAAVLWALQCNCCLHHSNVLIRLEKILVCKPIPTFVLSECSIKVGLVLRYNTNEGVNPREIVSNRRIRFPRAKLYGYLGEL